MTGSPLNRVNLRLRGINYSKHLRKKSKSPPRFKPVEEELPVEEPENDEPKRARPILKLAGSYMNSQRIKNRLAILGQKNKNKMNKIMGRK